MTKNEDKPVLNLSRLFFVQELLKTLKLIIILICISFFTGLLWYIFCDLFEESNSVNFISEFELVD